MKRLRQLLFLLVCLCLIIPSGVPKKARAQNNAGDGKKVFDNYSTVVGMAYPAGGAVFKAAGEMLELFGYFGQSTDPVGEAINRLNQRLDALERRVSDLETRMRAVENEVFRTQNMARVRLLKSKQDALKLLVYKLHQKPTERRDKLALAKEAQIIAAGFLDDPDLWNWSDLRERDGVMLPADFKPLPALEYYVVALVAWMAAIDYATDGDYEFVKREYGGDLRKHAAYLSSRPGWKDGEEPASLPENIRARISCTLEPVTRQSVDRKCQIAVSCDDNIARVSRTVSSHEVIMPLNSDLCNVPAGESARGFEDDLEQVYGLEVMKQLAEKLERLRTRGTARDDYAGTFDPSTQTAQYLYAVKPNGDLLWYMHRTISRKTGPAATGAAGADASSDRTTESGGPVARQPQVARSGAAGQDPRIRVPAGHETFAKYEITHAREGPKAVGRGWGDARQLFSGGGGVIYVLTQEGKLVWYKHHGYADGRGVGSPGAWEGPKEVGSNWDQFKRIIPGGDGVIYVVAEDNRLKWIRHINYAAGAKSWEEPPKDVGGPMWGEYKHVFSTGGGVIYAVTDDGKLLWYRNADYLHGAKSWEGPKVVGSGWQNFRDVFSPGEGVIYALTEDGHLLWYRHDGYRDGSVSWHGPASIAADWNDFLFVFPNLTGTWAPPVVR